jgi:hypothetical protein
MPFFYFGNIIYLSVLFTNAIAILNEDRFLAKSESLSIIKLAVAVYILTLPQYING